MNTCKNCLFWSGADKKKTWGFCRAHQVRYEFQLTEPKENELVFIPTRKDGLSVVVRDGIYDKHLTTGKDFGCVHWAKQASDFKKKKKKSKKKSRRETFDDIEEEIEARARGKKNQDDEYLQALSEKLDPIVERAKKRKKKKIKRERL